MDYHTTRLTNQGANIERIMYEFYISNISTQHIFVFIPVLILKCRFLCFSLHLSSGVVFHNIESNYLKVIKS